MQQIGFSLIDAQGNELQFWGDDVGYSAQIPNVITLPSGDRVHCPAQGVDYQGTSIVPRIWEAGSPPSIAYTNGNIVVTRPAPVVEAAITPPRVVASALAIQIANSDVSDLSGAFNLGGAIYLDVGQYMLLFITPQPDANYFAVVTGSAASLSVSEQTEDYLIVQASDGAGAPYDPARMSVQIFRME